MRSLLLCQTFNCYYFTIIIIVIVLLLLLLLLIIIIIIMLLFLFPVRAQSALCQTWLAFFLDGSLHLQICKLYPDPMDLLLVIALHSPVRFG